MRPVEVSSTPFRCRRRCALASGWRTLIAVSVAAGVAISVGAVILISVRLATSYHDFAGLADRKPYQVQGRRFRRSNTPRAKQWEAEGPRLFRLSCDHLRKSYDDLAFEVSSSLWNLQDDIRASRPATHDIHYMVEANVSIPLSILKARFFAGAYIAVMLNFIETNLTFVYNIVNCSTIGPGQPVRLIPYPIATRSLYRFRQDLLSQPAEGDIVDYFNCTEEQYEVLENVFGVSTLRIVADINLTAHFLTLKTCNVDMTTCTDAYDSWVPIDDNNLDFDELKTIFMASWVDQDFFDYTLSSMTKVTTWCKLVLNDERNS